MKKYEQQTRLFKALMHPTRLKILDILRCGEECVCHMEAVLQLRQANISQQLMILRDAGLVEVRRDGWNIFYHVTRPEIFTVIDAMNTICCLEEKLNEIHVRQSPGKCPCPKCNPSQEMVVGACGVLQNSES